MPPFYRMYTNVYYENLYMYKVKIYNFNNIILTWLAAIQT